ncbi:hypothetical protein F7Q99_14975 [Streptomyces kaniharaensis]|uniref:LPXTG cell wall anchor domain-containing protein n=1 Tax=Streptomyces kaniharaensis TaxID=212423 RepID=A0A6N7KU34_9ACTN|nr:hypothetical protein [Streptomyces kaniharaensis]MQS13534.1 hypothetical protein [Streptomyces kaniharaensis]
MCRHTWAPDASGSTGDLAVGMKNDGPASIMDRSGGEGAPHITVQFPEGVTVTGLPSTCRADDYVHGRKSDKPLNKFACNGLSDFFMADGATTSHKFGLKLPEGTGELAATVSLQNSGSEFGDGHPTAVMEWDRNPANDLVKVALRPGTPSTGGGTNTPAPTGTATAAATATATPTTAPTATPSATVAPAGLPGAGSPSPAVNARTSGDTTVSAAAGGSLAGTGSSAVLPMTGAGAAALVLGAASLLTARRLRARRNG